MSFLSTNFLIFVDMFYLNVFDNVFENGLEIFCRKVAVEFRSFQTMSSVYSDIPTE